MVQITFLAISWRFKIVFEFNYGIYLQGVTMNNKSFQKAKNMIFAISLAIGLLLPANSTLALPQKAGPAARPTQTITPVNPNDPRYTDNSQWNLNGAWGINAPTAWGITTGSASTVVAVLDSGIAPNDDVNGSRILPGYDFVSDVTNNDGTGRDFDPSDPGDYGGCGDSSWHGTHVAGIIGALSNNSTGIAGIDWNARILPVRVMGTCGSATAADIVAGMRWAAGLSVAGVTSNIEANRAKVINVGTSLPGVACTAYQADIDAIIAAGVVIVAPAGDTYPTGADASNNFPANCNGVISVAATDAQGNLATYSNYGSIVKISAPGGGNGQGDVLSTSNTGTTTPNSVGGTVYTSAEGTSMAAAHVSGVVSLMFAANPLITPSQVIQILQKTAKAFQTLGSPLCTTSICGSGIVDAGEAVRVANMPDLIITNVVLSNPAPSITDVFSVYITVKNQGGLNLGSLNANGVAYRYVYIGRDPSLISRDANGCLSDSGDYSRINNNDIIDSGMSATLSVDGVTGVEGIKDIYAYVDADCLVEESLEDNNGFPKVQSGVFAPGTLIYPNDNIGTDYNPTFLWNKVATAATHYHLYVVGSTGVVVDQWYDASLICDVNTCSVNPGPTVTLAGGNYSWYMQPYGAAGYGPWSAKLNFSTTIPTAPAAAVPTAPIGDIGTNYNPDYIWARVAGATYYHVYVSGPSGVVLDKWYTASSICNTTTCTVASPTLGGGAHVLYVQTWNPAGFGPWSMVTNFSTTPPSLPTMATNLLPNTDIGTNYTPNYTWDKVTGAAWYHLAVSGPSGTVLDKWYEASSICPTTTCTVTSPTLGGGAFTWYVQTYNSAGYGPWTAATHFNTTIPTAPEVATNLLPNTDIGTNYTPNYTWDKVATATYYHLTVSGPSGVVLDKWYDAPTICPTATCTVTSPTLGGGAYTWYVQTWNSAGYGPLSAATHFSATIPTTPAAATNLSPNTAIGTNYNPNFTWDNVANATYYHLYVSGPSGVVKDQWYQSSSICDVSTCTVASSTLGGGTFTMYVQTWNSAGFGPWSAAATFSTTIPTAPGKAVNLLPNTAIGANYNPNYTWDKVTTATWYHLYVAGPSGVVKDQWYDAATICPAAICTVASPTLGGGSYIWYVQTYNSAGYGPWSDPTTFSTTTPPLPTVATNLSPNTAIGTNYNPNYTWDKVAAAAWYHLVVTGPSGMVLDKWYDAATICPTATCTVASPTLGGGSFTWYVQTYNSTGYGPWTTATTFSTSIPTAPVGATLTAPVGTASHTPTYTWDKVPSATWYHLYVKGPGGLVKDQWYAVASICDTTTCTVVSPTLESGDHIWWVQTYNAIGYGPWKKATFTVP
jgi:serine protease